VRHRFFHGGAVDGASRVVNRQVATRRQRRRQPLHDRVRLVGVGDVVQDAQQHQRHRPGEVQGPRRLVQDLVRLSQVAVDIVADALSTAGEQRAGVQQHHRIVVGVDDPRLGSHPLGHLVGVVRGRQPGTDVQELADARLAGQVADRPAQKGPVRPGLGHDARQHRGHLVARLPVDGEVILAAEPVVPDPGRMGHRRIQL
jgi:hypothetical protein